MILHTFVEDAALSSGVEFRRPELVVILGDRRRDESEVPSEDPVPLLGFLVRPYVGVGNLARRCNDHVNGGSKKYVLPIRVLGVKLLHGPPSIPALRVRL